jgi:RNA polymerase sigma-70 factor (ECF subfamily)
LLNEDIINSAINRDRNAFRAIFITYREKIYRTAYLILKDHQHAEDAVQEIFLQVHLKIHKLTNSRAFDGWLYKITVNICYSMIRKLKKSEIVLLDENIEKAIRVEEVDFEMPDHVMLKKEVQTIIMECIYALPLKHRTVLTLFYFNNFTIKEIAEITEGNEGTIKSRLFYGKKVLKEMLIKQGEIIDFSVGGAVYEVR